MRIHLALMAIATFMLSACQSGGMQSYQSQVASIPAPTSEGERRQQCSYLRSEMARQQSIAALNTAGPYAVLVQNQARMNIASLESKAAEFECHAAFSSTIKQETKIEQKPAMKVCIESCKENTSRTSEQCFDSCNH